MIEDKQPTLPDIYRTGSFIQPFIITKKEGSLEERGNQSESVLRRKKDKKDGDLSKTSGVRLKHDDSEYQGWTKESYPDYLGKLASTKGVTPHQLMP